MLLFKYIASHYLKYFFVILFALVFFMVGFDYMGSIDRLPDSANLVLLFLLFKSFFAIDMLLPLSLIFSMIATKIFLIRSNALVAFYSLGYTRVDVLKPFVIVATLVIVIYIALHATMFARADEYSDNIRKKASFIQPSSNLFFTFENQYVYFKTLYPLQEKAEDVRIFTIKNGSLTEVMTAKKAYYKGNYWSIKEASIIKKPQKFYLGGKGIVLGKEHELKVLKNFKPKILDQVYEGKVNYTIIDAIEAYQLLKNQNINVDRIKASLYKNIIYPFFVPALVIIIFFFVPISTRFLNVTLFSFGAILATLLTWGVLFMGVELANNKTLSSEVGILLPVVIVNFIAFVIYKRGKLSL